MTYTEQLQVEQLNKEIINNIINTVSPEEFINFYLQHNQKETCEKFGLRTVKQLTKILTIFNYDFSKPKPSKFKGKASTRSHESYINAGKKSSETQQKHWEEKSDDEKQAWSIKQSKAHLTKNFHDLVISNNKAYRASLTPEEKAKQDELRSQSMKAWWAGLSDEEKDEVLNNRFKNGQSYNQKDSKPNLDFADRLAKNNIEFQREFCLDKKFFDFKVNDILIEIDPTFTHNSTFTPFEYNTPLASNYHMQKSNVANKYNYRCIHIFDWDNKDLIIKLLTKTQRTIYGRDCLVKEVDVDTANDFINQNHLQGSAKSIVKLGLYYNDELVSIMTFGRPRYNKNYECELIRYCSSAKILGGAEKLFKAFIEKYNPKSIISYCDLSKFSGRTYDKLGFNLLRKPTPSKHWYNVRTGEHYTDNLLRQQGFSRLVHHCDASEDKDLPSSNNRLLMLDAGFVEIYDCGQATYIWTNKADN